MMMLVQKLEQEQRAFAEQRPYMLGDFAALQISCYLIGRQRAINSIKPGSFVKTSVGNGIVEECTPAGVIILHTGRSCLVDFVIA